MTKSIMFFLISSFFTSQLTAQVDANLLLGKWEQIYLINLETGKHTRTFSKSDMEFSRRNRMSNNLLPGIKSYEAIPEDSLIVMENHQMHIKLLTANSLVFSLNEKGEASETNLVYAYTNEKWVMETPDIIDYVSSFETEESIQNLVFKVVDVQPCFSGCEHIIDKSERKKCGDDKMLRHIYGNIKYPAEARKNGIQGMVVINFIVEKDGSLSSFDIARDIGAGCGEEAMRAMMSMPKWSPGLLKDQPVRVQVNMPVKFGLE